MKTTAQLLRACQQQLERRQQRLVLLCTDHLVINAANSAALILDDQSSDRFAMHRYRDYLGTSNTLVVLNFTHAVHADALAALAGTVVAGGVLIINLPAAESAFCQRLLRHAEACERVVRLTPDYTLTDVLQQLSAQPDEHLAVAHFPSNAQQQIITTMLATPQTTHLIMADRGRGKSTTLGAALANYQGTARLVVTAPRRSQIDSLMQYAEGHAEFIAWERLLELPNSNILLVIDEAAGLPIHILQQLCQRFSVWGIATTVDGYEGCGRGFVIRFLDWLKNHQDFIQHSLEQALRWRNPDPAEDWLNHVLCLREYRLPITWQDGYQWVHASTLTDAQLNQVMQLLLEAHYQSSPNDLRLLLDDQRQHLLLNSHNGHLVGVLWVAEEGPVDQRLQADILAGTRRPAGDLLPQALAFKWQLLAPMQWRWWRIVRIAVSVNKRRQGCGSGLLKQLGEAAQQQQIDAIGSSFGAADEVIAFWQANNFQLIHRGVKRQMASGHVNAMVACGNSKSACQVIQQRLIEVAL